MQKVRLTNVIAVAAFSFVALLGMSACGENDYQSSSEAGGDSNAIVDSTNDASKDPQREDVVGVTLSGNAFSLREALQERPVVLWFWAPG